MEVYIRPFPGTGGQWQVSAGGGRSPRWSRDGRRLFYLMDNTVWGASISAEGNAVRVGRPQRIAEATDIGNTWDVSADGERFVFVSDPSASSTDKTETHNLVRFTFFWFDELRSLLDVGR